MEKSRAALLLEEEMLRKIALAKLDTKREDEHLEVAEALELAARIVSGEHEEVDTCGSATRLPGSRLPCRANTRKAGRGSTVSCPAGR